MNRASVCWGVLAVACVLSAETVLGAENEVAGHHPGATLTIRAIRPDAQLARVLALFEGERVGHPAEALAAWRRATGQHEGLSKAAQALIALLNPEMVAELRLLRDAEVHFGFDGPPGQNVWWSALLPTDDGTFASLATALALTDGAAQPPLDGAEVDRLGPPGAPLMARDVSGGVVLASDPAHLDNALDQLRADAEPVGDAFQSNEGWVARLDVPALGHGADEPEELLRRRIAEGLTGLGCREVEALALLRGEVLELTVTGLYPDGPPVDVPLDPTWLDWVPAERVAGAIAFATDEGGAAWGAAFAAADRVEQADPARAEVAPLRARLGLLALAAGIRPEADLWPLLRGITACVRADGDREPDGALIVLHARDEASARRIAQRVVRPLTVRLGAEGINAKVDALNPNGDEASGRVFGRPLELAVRDRSVLVAWGEGMLAASLEAYSFPDRSAGPILREPWANADDVPQRAGAFWPGRLRLDGSGPVFDDPVFLQALGEASPVLWWGTAEANETRDQIRWSGLRGLVQGILARLPMEPSMRQGTPD